jgi:methylmalonyl-CoA/ethylmalonyl-CoA epimerase
MAEDKVFEGEETHIMQVGVVVKNLEKTIEFLTPLGFGPFSIVHNMHPDAIVRGKKTFWETRVAHSQQGPVELELIEFQNGTSIQKEFLDEKGEGIHHICFKVRDIKATIDKFARKGIAMLQTDFQNGVQPAAYMDTTAIGGISIELCQATPGAEKSDPSKKD